MLLEDGVILTHDGSLDGLFLGGVEFVGVVVGQGETAVQFGGVVFFVEVVVDAFELEFDF